MAPTGPRGPECAPGTSRLPDDDPPVRALSPRHLAFVTPLVLLHAGCLLVFVVGASLPALGAFFVSSALQIFGITVGFHRFLAHRAFKTTRTFQFILAVCGTMAGQNGPLWWVAHHRQHHRYSDRDGDTHSPVHGLFWSHMGWLFSPTCIPVRYRPVTDLCMFPELRWLQEWAYLVNLAHVVVLFAIGSIWAEINPAAGTSGFQFVVWGFIVSTVWTYHGIWSANSICHRFGYRSHRTHDNSRNNWIVALWIFGDGWHHNHHFCPYSARHGFRWWEIDVNYGVLLVLSRLGLIWDLRVPRAPVLTVAPGRPADA